MKVKTKPRCKHADTYKAKADFGLPQCGAASHQAKEEHHHAHTDDDNGGDQCLPVLDKAVESVIALEHIGPKVGKRCSCSLERGDNSHVIVELFNVQ